MDQKYIFFYEISTKYDSFFYSAGNHTLNSENTNVFNASLEQM